MCQEVTGNMLKILFLISLGLCTAYAKNEELEGQSVYKINIHNIEQVQVLSEIAERLVLDVWSYAAPGREGHVLVPADLKAAFETELYKAGITYKVGIRNIKESVDLEETRLTAATSARTNSSRPGLSFDRIHKYDVVDQYLDQLGNLYPDVVTVVSAGKSFEGRDIKYLKLSTTNFEDTRKPIVMVMALLHAREWVTLPPILYAIEKLVIDVTEQDLINEADWIILPIANPDGYEYTHTTNRFWRKNRAVNPGSLCVGVDPNRNFEFNWGTESSRNPCSNTFHGQRPFSEVETQVIRRIILEHHNRIEILIDLHSFGSLILYPWGHGQLPPNGLIMHLVGVRMAMSMDEVKWFWKPHYFVGNVAAVLSKASGIAIDYAHSQDVPLTFTYELPAYKNNTNTIMGFLVDPHFIEQVSLETWEGFKFACRWVIEFGRRKLLEQN